MHFHAFGLLSLSKGYGLAIILGTSASESLSAAGNIFIGQTEAPLLVKVR
jgi:nucleoside permease NupC